MHEFTVHLIVVYRSKKDLSKYMTSSHTLSGDDISKRISNCITIESESWANEWEFVTCSHAFLPFVVGYQI